MDVKSIQTIVDLQEQKERLEEENRSIRVENYQLLSKIRKLEDENKQLKIIIEALQSKK